MIYRTIGSPIQINPNKIAGTYRAGLCKVAIIRARHIQFKIIGCINTFSQNIEAVVIGVYHICCTGGGSCRIITGRVQGSEAHSVEIVKMIIEINGFPGIIVSCYP